MGRYRDSQTRKWENSMTTARCSSHISMDSDFRCGCSFTPHWNYRIWGRAWKAYQSFESGKTVVETSRQVDYLHSKTLLFNIVLFHNLDSRPENLWKPVHLVADTQIYMMLCPSIRRSVCQSVCWSDQQPVALVRWPVGPPLPGLN